MRSKIFRLIAGMVSVLLLAGTPVHADPLTMNDILQIVGGYQSSAQLNLRSLPQAGKPISENATSLLAGLARGPRTSLYPFDDCDLVRKNVGGPFQQQERRQLGD